MKNTTHAIILKAIGDEQFIELCARLDNNLDASDDITGYLREHCLTEVIHPDHLPRFGAMLASLRRSTDCVTQMYDECPT